MNKGMIMLGILLLAGFSFAFIAGPWQYDWQNYVSWRYNCQFYDVGLPQYSLANYMYAYAQPYVQYSQLASMNSFLNYMGIADSGMMGHYYISPFSADMNTYNSNNAAFNAVFNAVLRAYLQHGGNSGYILGMLNAFNGNYRECISEGPWSTGIITT